MRLSSRAREERELRARIGWIGALFSVGLLLLAGRTWYLQLHRGEEYFARSSGNFVKELRVPADRGMIVDSRGRIMVDNRPSYDVYLTPAFCQDCEEVIGRLAAQLLLEDEDLSRVVGAVQQARGLERFRPVLVQQDLVRDDLDVLEANRENLPGVDIIGAPHRNYRAGPIGAHLIGYLGEIGPGELAKSEEEGGDYRSGDYLGRSGVERRYEKWLRGVDGVERVVADAKGRKLRELESLIPAADRYVAPTPGSNVILSIDARLQAAAEEAFDDTAGSLIVMDVNTGYLLAVVSKPGFDPNLMTGRISRAELREILADPLQPMLFRATQEHYHPGSVYKVVSQLAALEHGFHQDVFCGGGYTLGRRRWRCHKESGHGHMNPEAAMKVSCDTWFYAAADRLGIEPFAEASKKMGLGAITGLDLGFEVPGVVPSVEYYDRHLQGGYQRGFALNAVIGQGDSNVTPLQMAVVFAAIANGGTIYQPQVVRRIERPGGEILEEFLPVTKNKLTVKRENLETVRRGLVRVTNEPGGTGYARRLRDIPIAGKTGTAQVVRIGSVRLKKEQMDYFSRDHAWFAAYAPVEEPEIAVVVLNEHGGSGGVNAQPIAMRVIQNYFDIVAEDRLPPEHGLDRKIDETPAAPASSERTPTGPELPILERRRPVAG